MRQNWGEKRHFGGKDVLPYYGVLSYYGGDEGLLRRLLCLLRRTFKCITALINVQTGRHRE